RPDEGWRDMEDRGSDTQNHLDHPHISFEQEATGDPRDADDAPSLPDGGGGGQPPECEEDGGGGNVPPGENEPGPWGGHENGRIPDDALKTIPWASDESLRADAVDQLIEMNNAFRDEFGTDLGITDAYRTYAEQEYLYETKPDGMAAKPGTSNHGWALAVDFGTGINQFGTPQHEWMRENAGRYGRRHPDWAQQGPTHGESDRHRAATDAAAQKAAEQGHEAVRVRAHLSDGRSVDFVVRASGEVYDTTVPDEPVKPSRKKRALILVAAGLTGVLVIGGGAFVLGHALGDAEPVAVETTPPPPAGAGTDIPVGLPPAFSSTAAWSAQVDDKAVVRELSDGRLLTITEARTLTILDPDRGEPQWVGSSAPTDLTDVHETTWQGRPVLAAASSQS